MGQGAIGREVCGEEWLVSTEQRIDMPLKDWA